MRHLSHNSVLSRFFSQHTRSFYCHIVLIALLLSIVFLQLLRYSLIVHSRIPLRAINPIVLDAIVLLGDPILSKDKQRQAKTSKDKQRQAKTSKHKQTRANTSKHKQTRVKASKHKQTQVSATRLKKR